MVNNLVYSLKTLKLTQRFSSNRSKNKVMPIERLIPQKLKNSLGLVFLNSLPFRDNYGTLKIHPNLPKELTTQEMGASEFLYIMLSWHYYIICTP